MTPNYLKLEVSFLSQDHAAINANSEKIITTSGTLAAQTQKYSCKRTFCGSLKYSKTILHACTCA